MGVIWTEHVQWTAVVNGTQCTIRRTRAASPTMPEQWEATVMFGDGGTQSKGGFVYLMDAMRWAEEQAPKSNV